MGPKQSQNVQASEDRLNRNHFEFLHVVGKGGFGKVWKVLFKKTKKPFALKEMSKVKVIDRKSERSIMYERELLAKLKHPFIVNMQYAFQDYDNLYLVMDLLTGGDLRYHISRHKRFSEEQTRFFVACIVLGLEYVHNNRVIHRDIKPENLVLDERGYVRITDFGVAKVFQKENSSETSGTPGYMAPEVMCAQNHSFVVDYFAVGVMAFEFMYGVRPYLGKSRKEIKDLILSKQVQIKPGDIYEGWSIEAADFINKMLQRKPVNRLGYNGISEIKEHPWLKYYPWRDLFEKNLEAPFSPRSQDNYDKKYCEGPDKIGNDTLERYQNYYKNEALNEIFINYSFENILTIQEKENPNTTSTKKPLTNNSSQGSLGSSTKKKSNTLSASINNLNKISINQLLKSKIKITESLYLNNNINNNSTNNNKNNNNSKNTIKISSSISSIKTPNQTKNYSNLNLLKTKNKPSIGSASSLTSKQLSATPYRFNYEKPLNERLPFIDNKSIVSKHVSSHSLVTKKLVNTPSVGKPVNNKYSSLASSSTGNSTISMNFLHRRSGSTNTANKY